MVHQQTNESKQAIGMQVSLTHIILIYLGAINLVTFFVFGIDKWKAKRSTWRIPEAKLLWLSVAM